MEKLISSIESCIKSGNPYGALVLSLVLPDVCSSCNDPDGQTSGEKYASWLEKYIDAKYKAHLSGTDVYAFRCSYLHQGIFDTKHQHIQKKARGKDPSSRVLDKFSWNSKGSHLISFSGNYAGHEDDGKQICHLSVEEFSKDVVAAARKWIADVSDDELIGSRIEALPEINCSTIVGGFASIK